MRNKFLYFVLSGGFLAFVITYLFHSFGLVHVDNEVYMRFISLGLFILGVLLLFLGEIKKFHWPLTRIRENNSLIVISLGILLIATIFHKKVGIYATGFFVLMSLIHLALNKKLYKLNKMYYFLFGYVLFLFIGTINTQKGFHFPELTYTFVLVPVSFCFFNLSYETLLRIARLFFRAMIIFLVICVLYWWYNFLHLDAEFFHWLTKKTSFLVDMPGWEVQRAIMRSSNLPAYFFVNSWSYYSHPSYISLVLFLGLIIGFYLYYKQEKQSPVSGFELAVYIALCFFVEMLMESRIGFVGCCFILLATGLYYAKLRLNILKIFLVIYLIAGSALFLCKYDKLERFMGDKVRVTLSTLAINYIEDHFWWGSGTQEQYIALKYQEEKMIDVLAPVEELLIYTHNQFLGNMVQFGIWGLIVLLIVLYGIVRYAVKERSYLLQMLMAFFILFMMIEEPLYTQEGITRFTVSLVFLTAINESKKERKCIELPKAFNRLKN